MKTKFFLLCALTVLAIFILSQCKTVSCDAGKNVAVVAVGATSQGDWTRNVVTTKIIN